MKKAPPPTLSEIIAKKRANAAYMREYRSAKGRLTWRERKIKNQEKREEEMKKNHAGSPHRYKKVRRESGKVIFRCMRPLCTHFVPRELAIGAITLCWGCDKPTVMSNAAVHKRVKPLCPHCITRGKQRNKALIEAVASEGSIQEMLDKMGITKS